MSPGCGVPHPIYFILPQGFHRFMAVETRKTFQGKTCHKEEKLEEKTSTGKHRKTVVVKNLARPHRHTILSENLYRKTQGKSTKKKTLVIVDMALIDGY
jgi:hypothetical protein